MFRTPLLSALAKRIYGQQTGTVSLSRRRMLRAIAGLAAGMALPGSRSRADSRPRVAIVGAGLAGLTAALALTDLGFRVAVFEAAHNVGGRTRSNRPQKPGCGSCHRVASQEQIFWAEGQGSDLFGEFIDSDHHTLLALAKRFDLKLIDLPSIAAPNATDTVRVLDGYYAELEFKRDLAKLRATLNSEFEVVNENVDYRNMPPKARHFDQMTLSHWINTRVTGGLSSPLGTLLNTAYTIEFGADARQQSALNLLTLMREGTGIYGASDERYRVAGGIQSLAEAIFQAVGARADFHFEHRLRKIKSRSGTRVVLDFDAGHAKQISFDALLLAVPFAAYKHIDYTGAGFDARKARAIHELGAGKNVKVSFQFSRRHWQSPGAWGIGNGNFYSDTIAQAGWEMTRGQSGDAGILSCILGGSASDIIQTTHPYAIHSDPALTNVYQRILSALDKIYPGLAPLWNGKIECSVPHANPLWECSYPYLKPGQYQDFHGYEGVPQHNIFFAGDHTSMDYQGWMEGAAAEGLRAALEIARRFGGPT